ncbi:hypothetical protein ZWY2020_005942 [Hordeum vulgare]|nr:hypothetical protein ZWY2020_005942 [Hordeum vulgare]
MHRAAGALRHPWLPQSPSIEPRLPTRDLLHAASATHRSRPPLIVSLAKSSAASPRIRQPHPRRACCAPPRPCLSPAVPDLLSYPVPHPLVMPPWTQGGPAMGLVASSLTFHSGRSRE